MNACVFAFSSIIIFVDMLLEHSKIVARSTLWVVSGNRMKTFCCYFALSLSDSLCFGGSILCTARDFAFLEDSQQGNPFIIETKCIKWMQMNAIWDIIVIIHTLNNRYWLVMKKRIHVRCAHNKYTAAKPLLNPLSDGQEKNWSPSVDVNVLRAFGCVCAVECKMIHL